jgi:hypothetical protein
MRSCLDKWMLQHNEEMIIIQPNIPNAAHYVVSICLFFEPKGRSVEASKMDFPIEMRLYSL